MIYRELADTLIALAESVQAPPEAGLVVTEAEVELPLEIFSGVREGALVFYGSPPHTRWKTGVLPTAHMARIRVTLYEEVYPDAEASGGR